MTANFKISVYDTVKIRAEFDENNGHQWVNVYLTGKESGEVSAGTLFFDNRAVAKAYADAINGVDASPVAVDEQEAA